MLKIVPPKKRSARRQTVKNGEQDETFPFRTGLFQYVGGYEIHAPFHKLMSAFGMVAGPDVYEDAAAVDTIHQFLHGAVGDADLLL